MKNKIVCIDFKKNYLYSKDDIVWTSFAYIKKYNRIVIENVDEVIYKDNYICVYYKDNARSKQRLEQAFEIATIKEMVIN